MQNLYSRAENESQTNLPYWTFPLPEECPVYRAVYNVSIPWHPLPHYKVNPIHTTEQELGALMTKSYTVGGRFVMIFHCHNGMG